MIQARTRMKRF